MVNDAKEFVWERGNKEDTAQIPVENIPVVFQSGSMDTAALTSALGKTAIDLTGCTLDEILYFVSNKRPVLAAADGGCVIITGYDDYGNLILLKPGETETYFYGPEDSHALFEAAGNQVVIISDRYGELKQEMSENRRKSQMNMRFFCDTAWNHKNVQSKIAQKTGKI